MSSLAVPPMPWQPADLLWRDSQLVRRLLLDRRAREWQLKVGAVCELLPLIAVIGAARLRGLSRRIGATVLSTFDRSMMRRKFAPVALTVLKPPGRSTGFRLNWGDEHVRQRALVDAAISPLGPVGAPVLRHPIERLSQALLDERLPRSGPVASAAFAPASVVGPADVDRAAASYPS